MPVEFIKNILPIRPSNQTNATSESIRVRNFVLSIRLRKVVDLSISLSIQCFLPPLAHRIRINSRDRMTSLVGEYGFSSESRQNFVWEFISASVSTTVAPHERHCHCPSLRDAACDLIILVGSNIITTRNSSFDHGGVINTSFNYICAGACLQRMLATHAYRAWVEPVRFRRINKFHRSSLIGHFRGFGEILTTRVRAPLRATHDVVESNPSQPLLPARRLKSTQE